MAGPPLLDSNLAPKRLSTFMHVYFSPLLLLYFFFKRKVKRVKRREVQPHKRTQPLRGVGCCPRGGVRPSSVSNTIQHETSRKRPKPFWRQWNVATFWRQKVISKPFWCQWNVATFWRQKVISATRPVPVFSFFCRVPPSKPSECECGASRCRGERRVPLDYQLTNGRGRERRFQFGSNRFGPWIVDRALRASRRASFPTPRVPFGHRQLARVQHGHDQPGSIF